MKGESEKDITMEELMEFLKKLKMSKAPGPDQVTAEILKYMGGQGQKYFSD